jgi:hypothetical protein
MDDEFKCDVLNLLYSWDKTFYAAGMSNMPECWKKFIIILKMSEGLVIHTHMFFFKKKGKV